MREFEELERFTLGMNERCGYDFDYDPVTRWGKWTRSYPLIGSQDLDYRDLSFAWRGLRLIIGYVVLALLIIPFGNLWYPSWDYLPDRICWARVLFYYTILIFPFLALIQSVVRLDQRNVLTELAPGKPLVMRFNPRHSLWITVALFAWLFIAVGFIGAMHEGAIPEAFLPPFLE